MINYSLSAHPSNPSEENSEKKVYAVAQYNHLLDLNDIAKHITEHNSPFSKGTIMGILTDTVSCIRENLLLGNKVRLGDMGAFHVSLSSEGADSVEDFSTSLIHKVNVCWTPSEELNALLNQAKFQMVDTRKLQAQGRKTMLAEVAEVVSGSANSDGGSSDNQGGSGQGDPGDVTP